MKRQYFLNSITYLVNIVKKNNSDEVFQQIIDLFKEYLSMHPYDTEIWLKFALLFLQLSKDEDNALDCLKKILVYNPENVTAKILYGCFADYFGGVDKQVFELVCSIKTNDQELLSIQEFEKSLYYYSYKDQTQCKEALLKSINYCDIFVWNYKHLGLYYLYEEKNYKEAGYCFQKALNNIQYVYSMTEHYDSLNVEEFINERLKGIHLTEPNFESIQNLLESCK